METPTVQESASSPPSPKPEESEVTAAAVPQQLQPKSDVEQPSPVQPPVEPFPSPGQTANGGESGRVEMKLFVGRIPRSHEEEQLRPVFEAFGQVLEVAILKDKTTQQHKGSAFVRMASITQADAAIRALNNVKALDPQLGAIQVRYATGEAEKFGFSMENGGPGQDQVKLFVGSLPRQVTEEEIRVIFAPYGTIDEVYLLKDNVSGVNKGCAFVKFAFKEQAIYAIRALNGALTIPGGPRPIEVRVAESKKAQMALAAGNFGGVPMPGVRPMAMGQVGTAVGMPQSQAGVPTSPGAAQVAAAAAAFSNANPRQAGAWKEYFTQDGRPYYHNAVTNATQWDRPQEFQQLTQSVPTDARAAGDATGPPGANIFVFHIPNDWAQQDLIQNFSHFGTIVSARIATDKTTFRNKGYAFVSYDNIQSAVHAVVQMNGFMACGKRLKVSIKQHEERYVAHLLPQAGMAGGGVQPQQQQVPPPQGPPTYGAISPQQPPATSAVYGAAAVPGQPAGSLGMMNQTAMTMPYGVPAQMGQQGFGMPPAAPPGAVQQMPHQAGYANFAHGTNPASQRFSPY